MEDLVDGSNIFAIAVASEIRGAVEQVRARTDAQGFSIIRGVFGEREISRLRNRIEQVFQPTNDCRISGEYRRGSADFQRLDLGEYAASIRFARYFFFFPWNNDDAFTSVNEVQMDLFNRLAGKSAEFGSLSGIDPNPRRFRMSFVLQYPRGGGFMSRHREHDGEERGDKSYVVYLALTTRGQDFDTGGAYVYRGETRLDIEARVRAGDLVVYRGDRFHGVDGIDRDQPVELGKICGRMILTTVVKYFPS